MSWLSLGDVSDQGSSPMLSYMRMKQRMDDIRKRISPGSSLDTAPLPAPKSVDQKSVDPKPTAEVIPARPVSSAGVASMIGAGLVAGGLVYLATIMAGGRRRS